MRCSAVLRAAPAVLGLVLLPTALSAQSTPPATAAPQPTPEQVQVTFYSSGSFFKGAVPGYKYGMFNGRIMDEYDQLAMLTPGHFVTFNLDAGPHTFSSNSWMIPRPEGGGHLELDLVPGHHYFIGTYLQNLPFLSLYRIEQRTCEQAQQDNAHTSPLAPKHLKKYGGPRVIAETSFPACS